MKALPIVLNRLIENNNALKDWLDFLTIIALPFDDQTTRLNQLDEIEAKNKNLNRNEFAVLKHVEIYKHYASYFKPKK